MEKAPLPVKEKRGQMIKSTNMRNTILLNSNDLIKASALSKEKRTAMRIEVLVSWENLVMEVIIVALWQVQPIQYCLDLAVPIPPLMGSWPFIICQVNRDIPYMISKADIISIKEIFGSAALIKLGLDFFL